MLYSYTTELHLSIVGETLLREYIYIAIYIYIFDQTYSIVSKLTILLPLTGFLLYRKFVVGSVNWPKFLQKNFGLVEKKI